MVKSQFIEMFGESDIYKSLCDICRPKQWPTIPTKDFTKEGYLVYGANGVIGHYSSFNHEHPTILMACRGASCGSINISKPYSYITGNAMCMDDLSDEITFEYLAYYLSNYNYNTIITGGAQPQITYSNLKKVLVPIPPIKRQNDFAMIYQQADKSEFDGFKSQFIEMFKEDNMIPLGQFCIIEKGTTITREQVSPGNIPVVAGGKEPSCYHNNSNRDAGAITVSASGAYAGYVNYWDMPIFASDCNTIKPKQNYDVDVTFLYSGLKAMQNEIYDLQKGGAQPHVYGKDLEKVLFPLPIHEKQLNFSAIAKHADKSESVWPIWYNNVVATC